MIGHVALVLHAHLPWVHHPEHARPLEERWLHEALWESYLPLLAMLDRLAHDGVRIALTVSISPPLAAMLADDVLRARFSAHLERTERLAAALAGSAALEPGARALMPFYQRRLAEVRAVWDRIHGDVLAALRAHEQAGRIELMTSTATHAYLPGLLASPASIRAQLRLGLRAFAALSGLRPQGLWLPECAYDPRLGPELAAAGVGYTILDAHGIDLAHPRPPSGVLAPVLGPSGVAFFARDPEAARDVWSRQGGYPGDPAYREFYRDVGFDLPEGELLGELGPDGTRLMTGLKPYRITGPGPHKEPYDPETALTRAREHAHHFVAKREALARGRRRSRGRLFRRRSPPPILVAPFDAELFGHWWFEGPDFLEHVLRALDASARDGYVSAITLGGYLERFPDVAVAEPAASSWGEGGFGAVWAGPESARLWRHVHHAERAVRSAVSARRHAEGLASRALDQAIRELLLLESSDWAFMIRRGEMTAYAEERVRTHAHRAARLAEPGAGREHDAGRRRLAGRGVRPRSVLVDARRRGDPRRVRSVALSHIKQGSSQATNALHALSLTQAVPAVVVQAEFACIISCVVRHVVQAEEGVPLGGRGAVAVAGRGRRTAAVGEQVALELHVRRRVAGDAGLLAGRGAARPHRAAGPRGRAAGPLRAAGPRGRAAGGRGLSPAAGGAGGRRGCSSRRRGAGRRERRARRGCGS